MNKACYRKSLAAAAMALLLGACSTTRPPAVPESAPAPAPAPERNLPKVELTPNLLYEILLGEIAGQRGHLGVAVQALGEAAQKTRDPRLAERATLAALYARRYPDALAMARLWVQTEPDSIEAQEALAATLMELNQPKEAQRHFAALLALAKTQDAQDEAYLRIANVLSRSRNHTVALAVMTNLVQMHPRDAVAYLALANLAVRSGQLGPAEAAVDRALALRPDLQDAALFKGRILAARNDPAKTEAFYDDYLRRFPRATLVRANYARYLVELKEWDKAREQFKQVAEASPDDADALYAVGLLALQTRHLKEAEQYLQRTLKLQPDNDQARLYLGEVAEQRGDYAEAAQWYREVRSPDYYFEAQTRIGVMLAKQGDLAQARAYLHGIAPQTDREQVELTLAEQQILRDAKQYREALTVLDAGLAKVPGNNDLLYARALIEEKLNSLPKMEQDLRAILHKDPKNAQALNALGYTLADRTHRYQEALGLIQQALALRPNDPYILDSMGWVQYRLGNTAEAITYLKRALALSNDAEVAAHLGEVLWVSGDHAAARSVWDRALRQAPDNEALLDVMKKFKQ